jgi:hypothetical protein
MKATPLPSGLLVAPAGVMHDVSGGRLKSWRKNRQPTPGSSAVG